MDNLLSLAITGLYSVTLLVFGQHPVLVVTDGLDIGQQSGAASPAQQGLVQSGGQGFGQHSGGASPAQHGSVRPSGQASASNPAVAF